MKHAIGISIVWGMIAWASLAGAQDKATPEDVFNLVQKAYQVVSSLGEEGLQAFNEPKGEFIYKDTYIFAMQCPEYIVAHPFALDKLKGKDLREKYPFQVTLCDGGKDPNGSWVEYKWPKPGSTEPARKISFVIRVKDTPYTVAAGIYNEDMPLAELPKSAQ